MTAPGPVERLREAAEHLAQYHGGIDPQPCASVPCGGMATIRDALSALTPEAARGADGAGERVAYLMAREQVLEADRNRSQRRAEEAAALIEIAQDLLRLIAVGVSRDTLEHGPTAERLRAALRAAGREV